MSWIVLNRKKCKRRVFGCASQCVSVVYYNCMVLLACNRTLHYSYQTPFTAQRMHAFETVRPGNTAVLRIALRLHCHALSSARLPTLQSSPSTLQTDTVRSAAQAHWHDAAQSKRGDYCLSNTEQRWTIITTSIIQHGEHVNGHSRSLDHRFQLNRSTDSTYVASLNRSRDHSNHSLSCATTKVRPALAAPVSLSGSSKRKSWMMPPRRALSRKVVRRQTRIGLPVSHKT